MGKSVSVLRYILCQWSQFQMFTWSIQETVL